VVVAVVEEAQQRQAPVERAVPLSEAMAGDAAAPLLANEAGTDEAHRFIRREMDEDVFDELLRQVSEACPCHRWRWLCYVDDH